MDEEARVNRIETAHREVEVASLGAKRSEQIHTLAPSDESVSLRGAWRAPRILLRPRPGFYTMQWRRGAPLVPALVYQLCPMVIPQPTAVDGPNPDEWCRPLDRSPRHAALNDGKRVSIDRVWSARSLRAVSPEDTPSASARCGAGRGPTSLFRKPDRNNRSISPPCLHSFEERSLGPAALSLRAIARGWCTTIRRSRSIRSPV